MYLYITNKKSIFFSFQTQICSQISSTLHSQCALRSVSIIFNTNVRYLGQIWCWDVTQTDRCFHWLKNLYYSATYILCRVPLECCIHFDKVTIILNFDHVREGVPKSFFDLVLISKSNLSLIFHSWTYRVCQWEFICWPFCQLTCIRNSVSNKNRNKENRNIDTHIFCRNTLADE